MKHLYANKIENQHTTYRFLKENKMPEISTKKNRKVKQINKCSIDKIKKIPSPKVISFILGVLPISRNSEIVKHKFL